MSEIPFHSTLSLICADNAWLRFAGWKVGLHPEPSWNLTLSAPEVEVDLRGIEIAGLAVTGEGSIKVGEATGSG